MTDAEKKNALCVLDIGVPEYPKKRLRVHG